MSLWTDRELKTLIARVNALEARVNAIDQPQNRIVHFGDGPHPTVLAVTPITKRGPGRPPKQT